jgi:hypothetical protein
MKQFFAGVDAFPRQSLLVKFVFFLTNLNFPTKVNVILVIELQIAMIAIDFHSSIIIPAATSKHILASMFYFLVEQKLD